MPAAEEAGDQGTRPAPATGLAEKKEVPVPPAVPIQENKDSAQETAHETLYVFLLTSGARITAVKYMDFGETYALKDEQGQFRNIKKEDVRKILEPLHPPAKAEPVKPKAGAEAAEAKLPATPEPSNPETRKPEPAAKPAPGPAANPPAKNGPQAIFVLKDGRREKAFQYYQQGEYYVLQSTGGDVVKGKKADVGEIEE